MAGTSLKTTLARKRTGLTARYYAYLQRPSKIDHPSPSKPLSRLLAAYGPDGDAPEILHLGGSESEQVSYNDWDKRTLRRMLRRRMAPLRVCQITNTGYNSEVYAPILRALEAMPKRPQAILVHVVARMGNPLWFHNPTWRFEEDRAALDAYAADPSAGVGLARPYPRWLNPMRTARDPDAFARYLNTPASYPDRPERTVGECLDAVRSAGSQRERERLSYTFNFLHETPEDHPRLQATTELFAVLERLGLPYVCYVVPQNHELGRDLLGEAWDAASARNLEQVRRAAGPGAQLHDWLELLPARCFYDSVEHWDETGRPIVAERMERALRAALAAPAPAPALAYDV